MQKKLMLAVAAVMMLAACNGAKQTHVLAQFGDNAPARVKVTVGDKADTVVVVKDGKFEIDVPVDVTTLSRIITRGLSKSGRILEIETKIADKPGSLIKLLQIVSSTGANVLSVSHDREDKDSDVSACVVSMVLETRDASHIEQLLIRLESAGYPLYEA